MSPMRVKLVAAIKDYVRWGNIAQLGIKLNICLIQPKKGRPPMPHWHLVMYLGVFLGPNLRKPNTAIDLKKLDL